MTPNTGRIFLYNFQELHSKIEKISPECGKDIVSLSIALIVWGRLISIYKNVDAIKESITIFGNTPQTTFKSIVELIDVIEQRELPELSLRLWNSMITYPKIFPHFSREVQEWKRTLQDIVIDFSDYRSAFFLLFQGSQFKYQLSKSSSEQDCVVKNCLTILPIAPDKQNQFIEILMKLIMKKYLIIIKSSEMNSKEIILPCFYKEGATELSLRKYLVSFAELLRIEGVVNPPHNSGSIPTKKYIKAFGYTLNKTTFNFFDYKKVSNQINNTHEEELSEFKSIIRD